MAKSYGKAITSEVDIASAGRFEHALNRRPWLPDSRRQLARRRKVEAVLSLELFLMRRFH